MATITKTFVENEYSSNRSTWTFTFTSTNKSVNADFTLNPITATAKYVGSNKGYAGASAYFDLYIDDVKVRNADNYVVYASYRLPASLEVDDMAWASNTTKTLAGGIGVSDGSLTIPLSSIFTSSNKNKRTLSVTGQVDGYNGFYGYSRNANWDYENWFEAFYGETVGELATITLDAPPIAQVGTPTYATPHYAGLGAYSVPVTSATAQYGGDVSTITLTIGSDSVTQNYATPSVTNQTLSLVPSIAGTYTPTIAGTDSRGQVTSVNLNPVIVNAYNVPNVSFDIQRCTDIGKLDVEGEYGLVSARISYTSAIANLTQPTITVQDESGTTITSSAIWYTSWTAQSGVQNVVNWTNYNPQSPVTLYGVISATGSVLSPSKSYIISVTPTDNLGGVATTITQTLPSSFFTIDFQAGGKEIAFGAVADDDVTNYPEGLFKCAMSFKLKDNLFWVGTRSEYEQAVADDKMPEHTIVFITDETADYVVEQGTSGDWIYRKWNSGIAECWCKKTATTNSGGTYNFNFACPTFFISTQPIYVTGSAWSSGYTTTVLGYTNTAYSSGAWRIDAWLVNGKASASCGATFKVIGKWK